MPPRDPLLLRLPFWLVDRAFRLELVLAKDPTLSWSRGYALMPSFELSGPERSFARTLLSRKRNLWLYRCHQKELAGDFAVVDMSSPSPSKRPAFVVELKAGAPVRLGGSGAAGQLQRADQVIAELRRLGVAEGPSELVSGGVGEVLGWLGVDLHEDQPGG